MSILLFLFRRLSVARGCRFWLSVLPRVHVSLCCIYKFHSVYICSSFPGRFWLFITSWSMLSVVTFITFIQFCAARFAVSQFAYFAVFCVLQFRVFSQHEKILILLRYGRSYLLLHLLNSFCVARFAGLFPA